MNLQNIKYNIYYDDIIKNNNYNEWFIVWELKKDLYIFVYNCTFFSESFMQ